MALEKMTLLWPHVWPHYSAHSYISCCLWIGRSTISTSAHLSCPATPAAAAAATTRR